MNLVAFLSSGRTIGARGFGSGFPSFLASGLLVLTGPLGCWMDGADATQKGPTVRDSAGVTIVENQEPVWRDRPGFSIQGRPRLEIGSLEGDPNTAFGRLSDASRLSDGRIVVLEGQTNEVRVFGEEGRFLALWGRQGEGPGEFGMVWSANRLPGDTLVVFDRRNRSATFFAPDGTPVRRVQHPLPFRPQEGQMMSQSCCIPLGAAEDGSLLWRYPQVWPTDGPGQRPTHTTVVRVSPDGSSLDTLGAFEAGTAAPWEGPSSVVPVTFSTVPSVHVHGRVVYEGNGSSFSYTVRDLSGRPDRIVRAAKSRTPVSPEYVDGWRERERARFGASPEARPERVRWILDKERADSLPAYSQILVDDLDHVWLTGWIEPSFFRSAGRTYQVFDADGVWLGETETPEGFMALEIGVDHVLGIRWGGFDEPYLVLYDLDRG